MPKNVSDRRVEEDEEEEVGGEGERNMEKKKEASAKERFQLIHRELSK